MVKQRDAGATSGVLCTNIQNTSERANVRVLPLWVEGEGMLDPTPVEEGLIFLSHIILAHINNKPSIQ
jgi:hypothetical protein